MRSFRTPGAREVLGAAADGTLSGCVGHELELASAAKAHRLLESRRAAGKIMLIPP
jgi:NADPH:quinone reductase-like Zn-dependent oxidoreductase